MAWPFINICSPCAPKDCETDIYCGPPLVNIGVETNDSMVVALQKIDATLAPTTTTTTTSGTTTTTTTVAVPQYKIYRGVFLQSGTDDPIISVIGENTIGNIVWTRIGIGEYRGTLTNAFVLGKTNILGLGGLIGNGFFLNAQYVSVNYITITTRTHLNISADSLLSGTSIEIKVEI